MYVCMYVCMYICMYVCVFVCRFGAPHLVIWALLYIVVMCPMSSRNFPSISRSLHDITTLTIASIEVIKPVIKEVVKQPTIIKQIVQRPAPVQQVTKQVILPQPQVTRQVPWQQHITRQVPVQQHITRQVPVQQLRQVQQSILPHQQKK